MLNLANLRSLLAQIISPFALHTAVLFTPEGQLVSFVADPPRSKDEIRVVVGLGGEIWQETKEHGIGMVDSEVTMFILQCCRPIDLMRFANIDWSAAGACSRPATARSSEP